MQHEIELRNTYFCIDRKTEDGNLQRVKIGKGAAPLGNVGERGVRLETAGIVTAKSKAARRNAPAVAVAMQAILDASGGCSDVQAVFNDGALHSSYLVSLLMAELCNTKSNYATLIFIYFRAGGTRLYRRRSGACRGSIVDRRQSRLA
jgi:hypothetical protein